mgnify:CR=1 FL=1
MELVNQKIRLSYRNFYHCGISLNKVLPKRVSGNFVILLSALSYDRDVYLWFKKHCMEHFCSCSRQIQMLEEDEFIEPHTTYLAWKIIIARSEIVGIEDKGFDSIARSLFDFLLKVNDFLDDEDAKVKRNNRWQYIEHLYLDYYTDNVIAQFYRAQRIFIDSSNLKSFIANFESEISLCLKEYVYVIHRLLVRYGNLWEFYPGGIKNTDLLAYWKSNSGNIADGTNFNSETIEKVLSVISCKPDELKTFCNEHLFDGNIDFFRNYPFVQLSKDLYVPINDRLSQNLLFNNLFYKILDANKSSSGDFLSNYGKEFERYVYELALLINQSGNDKCIVQKEFTFKTTRKEGLNKSPDVMIVYPQTKQVIVFEVKSARILEKFNKSYSDKDSYEKSIEKTVFTPIVQSAKSITKIVENNATKLFDKSFRFVNVAVTMSAFAIPNYSVNVAEGTKERRHK